MAVPCTTFYDEAGKKRARWWTDTVENLAPSIGGLPSIAKFGKAVPGG